MILISQLIGQRASNPFFADRQEVSAPGIVWDMGSKDVLSPIEAAALIDDLGLFGSPFIMFVAQDGSLREDLLTLIQSARVRSMAAILAVSRPPRLAEAGRLLSKAGVSLVLIDAAAPNAEAFLANCQEVGIAVGVKQPLLSQESVKEAFALVSKYGLSACILQHANIVERTGGRQTRELMNAVYLAATQSSAMIATEGNRADAIYMYLRLRKDDPVRAKELRAAMFKPNTAPVYVDIAHVNPQGAVFPEEHWRWGTVGSVRERPFSKIWTDPAQPLLRGFRMRRLLVKGRCQLCDYLGVCHGNQRARAAATGDPWAEDPGCYLTDDEIHVKSQSPNEA